MTIGCPIAHTFQTSQFQWGPVETRVCWHVSNLGSLYKCHQCELFGYFSKYEILEKISYISHKNSSMTTFCLSDVIREYIIYDRSGVLGDPGGTIDQR